MNRRYIPIAAALVLTTAWTMNATAQDEVYSLKDCLEQGLENNYNLQITRNDEQIARNNATWANAGYLPTINLEGGYNGTHNTTETTLRETGEKTKQTGVTDHTLDAGVSLGWTLFDGLQITANHQTLKELKRQGETNTRIAIEDLVAEIAAEYYNLLQQQIRLKNFRYAVSLSKERLRIVEARYNIGDHSRLDYQQAKVDFNADSAQYMKQQELLHTSRIRLNELMGNENVNQRLRIKDRIIDVNDSLQFAQLSESMMTINAQLFRAEQNQTLAQLDYKKVRSRDYPYLKVNADYGYTYNKYEVAANSKRTNLGLNVGATLGFRLFDGNRKRERQNARIKIENARIEREGLELSLRAEISNLWQAYENNLQMLQLERDNLIAARDNHNIAKDRYLLGDLSGIEMREAQKSLLDAEERILECQYNTKLCEISLLQISGQILRYLED